MLARINKIKLLQGISNKNSVAVRYFGAQREKESLESVNAKIQQVKKAQEEFLTYDQAKVDSIFKAVAHAAAKSRIPLALAAHEETKMGCFEDKVIKNAVAAELTMSKYLDAKTVGIIEEDRIKKITKIAQPVGPIAAILPVTNPTSTVITKSLFALKTRNAMLFIPHPRAAACTAEAVRICNEAAVAAGAPDGVLQCVMPSREVSAHAMHHPDINMLLATGGPAMVHACYESGKPSLGVGAGNAGVLIDDTANIQEAVGSIILSKTFDNGMICASEQSVIILDNIYEQTKQAFIARGVHFVQGDEKKRLGQYLVVDGHINPDIIGQTAVEIAKRLNIDVPKGTIVLAAECTEVGPQEPLSSEKLSPLLSFYRAANFDEGCKICKDIVSYGGKGHTSAIYTYDRKKLDKFALEMPAFHLMNNMPTALGAIGTAFNFNVDPSLTLGVGSIGGSSLSGSLTPFHLLDIKTVAERQQHLEWIKNPPSIYFNRNCTEEAFDDLTKAGKTQRVLLVSDKVMSAMGHVQRVKTLLESKGFIVNVFDDVNPDPDMTTIRAGVKACEQFRPDTMICIGGGSPMDAGKFIRVLYESPHVTIDDLAARFVELRKRTQEFPQHGTKIHTLVCIPTTSGTASEITPFSVVTDDAGHKNPLFSYHMTPDIAIIDSSYTDKLPKSLIANAGLDAITHAVESYVSAAANDFTMPSSVRSLKLVFGNLQKSYSVGDPLSREKVHHGASIAGLAFSNSFLGVCHSLSHKIGAMFHLPHGLTNAILLPYVIEYNSDEKPTRMAVYPGYDHPQSLQRYAELARQIGCVGATDRELTNAFVKRFQHLAGELGVPTNFKALGISEQKFLENLRHIAIDAFDDQCSPANPRFPIVAELEEVLKKSFYGTEINI